MTLIPHDARIIVKPLEDPDTTRGGIVIPDNAKQKPVRGEVIAVGPGAFSEQLRERIPLPFKIGDVIIYDRYSGLEYKRRPDDVEKLVVLRAHDVLATEVA
jgi:chaperonin GroES